MVHVNNFFRSFLSYNNIMGLVIIYGEGELPNVTGGEGQMKFYPYKKGRKKF